MDQLLTGGYELASTIEIVEEPELGTELTVLRDSVPKLKRTKLETVILYITGKCGAKPRMDIHLLINMLYFCDFNHYELHEEQLTGLSYTKQPFGPSPDGFTEILKEMETENKLQRVKSTYNSIPQIKYLPKKDANLMKLNAAEKTVIDQVIEQFSDWPSTALKIHSSEDMPLRATKQLEPIDYELVFYRKAPYSVRIYDEDWSDS